MSRRTGMRRQNFTRIEKGSCTYQIHLETYDVEEGDLIFYSACGAACDFPMKKRSACSRKRMCFIWIFLGAKAADICALRYLNPLMNQKLIPPFVIKKGHPLYEKAADLFEDINTEYDKKTPGYEIAIKSYLLQFVAALIPYCTRNTEADAIFDRTCEKVKRSFKLYRCTLYGGTDDFRTCRNLIFSVSIILCVFSKIHGNVMRAVHQKCASGARGRPV